MLILPTFRNPSEAMRTGCSAFRVSSDAPRLDRVGPMRSLVAIFAAYSILSAAQPLLAYEVQIARGVGTPGSCASFDPPA